MDRYEETYRGVQFFINDVCSGLTGDSQKFLKGHYFSRFLTREEMNKTDIEGKKEAIRAGIDRLLSRNPVYAGDLRDRPIET